MALDVSVSCGDLEIDSVPDCKLRLRIGIHTGMHCLIVVLFYLYTYLGHARWYLLSVRSNYITQGNTHKQTKFKIQH